jgi:hypothetical protein
VSSLIDFEVAEKPKQYGVIKFERKGLTILLVYEDKSIILNIQKEGLFKAVRVRKGFIYRYKEYDYNSSGKSKIIHVHKYDQKIIGEQVKIALENQKGVNDVK